MHPPQHIWIYLFFLLIPWSLVSANSESPVKEARPSQSVENILQEEHALFDSQWIVETGFTYTHSNRRQLALSGFLALDAIFIGDVSVDDLESDLLSFDITTRYSFSDRLQASVTLPFIYRSTDFESTGAGGDASRALSERVTLHPELGDVSWGLSYRLLPETVENPDVVWNIGLKMPTGTDPYGVNVNDVPGSEGNLSVPSKLPSGNGVWSLSTGVSLVKTVDPAILFTNLSLFYNKEASFSDLDSAADTRSPGKIDLGEAIQIGFGTAFALSEKMSLSFSYTQRITDKAKRKFRGEAWQTISASDSNVINLNMGATYAMSSHLSLVTTLGIGLSEDAPDVSFGMKFPYRF